MPFRILQGDALAVLRTLPDESVNCCVTSPPYWNLRDYGVAGQIGLEPSPEEFVARLVGVFAEVRRVLRNDGTCWINLGDSYAGSWGNQGRKEERGTQRPINAPMMQNLKPYPDQKTGTGSWVNSHPTLKPKDLVGIPWRVAFALQADGWYLRSDIIWHKPNPMPESVTDRPTKAHEYIFLLSKSERYAYDADAIREQVKLESLQRAQYTGADGTKWHDQQDHATGVPGSGVKRRACLELGPSNNPNGRNKRTVWTVSTCPTPEAHFATYPPDLIEPCILAGCPEGGTVLDPFAGAGTTGLACLKNGRRVILIELNPEYITISENRARKYYPLLVQQAS